MAQLYPALLTVTDHTSQLDLAGMKQYVEWHERQDIADGYFVLGSTGEGPALPWTAQRDVLLLLKAVVHRPLIVMATAERCSETFLEKLSWLHDQGFHAIALAPPLYYAYPPESQAQVIREVANQWPGDVWLYNIPSRVGYALSYDTVADIVKQCPNVVGIKDSSGQAGNIAVWRELLPSGQIFCGAEQVGVASLLSGADGIVSQYASVVPELVHGLLTGTVTERLHLQASLNRLIQRADQVPLLSLLSELGFRRGMLPRRIKPPWPALDPRGQRVADDWLALRA